MDASAIVDKMMEGDAFSQWLGITVVSKQPGQSEVQMTVRTEMTNGFGIAHGGITYSLADSALAFSANAHGRHAMSVETSIAHMAAVHPGDVLTAVATETKRTNKLAWYSIDIRNQEDVLVATFHGLVYRTSRAWDVETAVGPLDT